MPNIQYDSAGNPIAEAPSAPPVSIPQPPPPPKPEVEKPKEQQIGRLQLYDKDANPVDIPAEKQQDALLSGKYGVAKGTAIPVEYNGHIGQVTPDRLHGVIAAGGKIASPEAYEEAALQHDYGDVASGLEAFGYHALNSALLDIPSEFLDEDTRKVVRNMSAANPGFTTAGKITGVAAPIIADIATGGALTPAIAPEVANVLRVGELGVDALEAARAANVAKEGLEVTEAIRGGSIAQNALGKASRLASSTFSAPTSAVSKVGDLVEAGVKKLIGDEATSLAGKLAQQGIAKGIRSGTETAIFGAADAWGEDNLKDKPELTGEKLWNVVSQDFWQGALLGAALPAAGLLGRSVAGRIAPSMAAKADEMAIRAIDSEGSLLKGAEKLTGKEQAAVRREFIDSGVISAGDTVETIAQKVSKKTAESEKALHDIYHIPEVQKLKGIPAGEFAKFIDETLSKTKIAELGEFGIDAEKLKQQIFELTGFTEKVTKEIYETPGFQQHLASRTLTFGQTAEIADALSIAAGKLPTAQGKMAARELLGKVESFLDTNLEKQVKSFTAAEKMAQAAKESPEVIAGYQKAKQIPDALLNARSEVNLMRRLDAAAQKSAEKGKETFLGHIKGLEVAGAIGALGHLAGIAHAGILPAIAAKVAAKLIKDRGKSTAAVILDKLATIGAARRAAQRVDNKIVSGLNKIHEGAEKIPKVVGDAKRYDQYKRVIDKWEKQGAELKVQALSATMARHAPRTAASFSSTAMRSINYLKQNFPHMPPNPSSLNPKWDKREPSDQQKAQAGRIFNAVTDPVSLLDRVLDGTITPPEIQAIQATHPEIYSSLQLQLAQTVGRTSKPLPMNIQRAMNLFLGKPPMDPRLFGMLQQNYQAPNSTPPGTGGGKAKGESHRLDISPALTVGLQGAGKSLKL